MAGQVVDVETVPQTVPDDVQAPRRVIKAGPLAVDAYREKVRKEREVLEQQRLEREEAEAEATRRGIRQAKAVAQAKGEEVEEDEAGRVTVARDGLHWLARKGKLHPAHLRAGLKFREDLTRMEGGGLVSCLAMNLDLGGSSFGSKSGVTDRQLSARSAVDAALKALGSPLLEPYVVHLAGRGEMLSAEVFGGDAKRADAHLLPCVIALDLLARHYGMIR